MKVLHQLLAASLLMVGIPAVAGLQLELQSRNLTGTERDASQVLLQEAFASLPPSFVERLDRRVEVRWSEHLPEAVFGRASRPDLLELNRSLLPALSDGSAASQHTDRPHGTVRRELLATVLHELMHLYDRQRAWSTAERRLLQRCRISEGRTGQVGLPRECRGQSARRFTLSDDPRLLDLAGWPQRVGTRGAREQDNGQRVRSPDSYELSNPREFVAVNFEYFLLDPQYACRRPALQRHLREHFGWQPAAQQPCPSDYAYLNAGLDPNRDMLARLDPARVYQIDYLLAEPNDAWVSRWGHSMLRLVVCAPGRQPGPDCRLDLEEHLVLSYRAFVGDLQLSSWDGLTGAYPSRLFILPLAQVIDEYTKLELRGLASVPLQLPRGQLERLVERAAEQHWSYDGDYYFVSNNCAVETLKLLRSGTGRDDLQDLDSITPTGLLDVLRWRGLTEHQVLDDPREALRLGYRFDSFRDRYQAMFEVLRQRLPVPQDNVEDWLQLPAEQRQPWLEKSDLRAAAALLLLEQAALRRQLLLIQEDLKRRYLAHRERPDAGLAEVGGTLEQLLADSGFLSRPAELLDVGYGLPLEAEWQALSQASGARQDKLLGLASDLDESLRKLVDEKRRGELEAVEANLASLSAHLRQLHRDSGGLVLP
jgi:hypothetical protein